MTNIHRIIPGYTEADNVTGCCPVFHPEMFDNQAYDLSDYTFIKDTTFSFVYMPVNINKVFTRTMNTINEDKQALYLLLSKDISKWIKTFQVDLKTNNETFYDLYIFYTTCPNCAKIYGHNYVVLFGRIE